jgi:hypothetical protein
MDFLLVRFNGLPGLSVVRGSVRQIRSMAPPAMPTPHRRSLLVPRCFRMA